MRFKMDWIYIKGLKPSNMFKYMFKYMTLKQ